MNIRFYSEIYSDFFTTCQKLYFVFELVLTDTIEPVEARQKISSQVPEAGSSKSLQ